VFPLKDNIPTERFPVVTVALIVANVFVYFVLQKGGILSAPADGPIVRFGAIPYELTHSGQHCALAGQTLACGPGVGAGQPPTWETVFTSMFLHGSVLHLAGNMLFLWIFGNNVEDRLGRILFLVFYLLGGLAALGLQVLVDPDSAAPTIGASGAIAAVLGGYVLLFPRARVVTVVFLIIIFTVIELPALLVLLLWFAEQAVFASTDLITPTGSSGGVAYWAHIGGFLFGLLTIRLLTRRPAR
jgi:membrane associated rhomboid family serine protease